MTPGSSPPASAASAATTTPPAPTTPSRWPTASSRRRSPSTSSTWARRRSTIFDHTIFRDNLVFVDFCEAMVKSTNPGVLARAEQTQAPRGDIHGYRTIADIMRSFNPFEGETYKRSPQGQPPRHARDVLPHGGAPRPPVDAVPRRRRHDAPADRVHRLPVPAHADPGLRQAGRGDERRRLRLLLYEALPGYEEVGRRRILLGCWGAWQNPDVCDYRYETMSDWGRAMHVTPASSSTASCAPTTSSTSTSACASSSAAPTTTTGPTSRRSSRTTRSATRSTCATRGDQTTVPVPQKRDFDSNYSWVASPAGIRPEERRKHLVRLDTGGGSPSAVVHGALNGLVELAVRQGHRAASVRSPSCRAARSFRDHAGVGDPRWSNAIGRGPGQALLRRLRRRHGLRVRREAMGLVRAGETKVFENFEVPDEAIGCGFHEAVRGVLSHHLVIKDKKIANYHPYPPTPWNASPRDSYGTPGPYEDAVQASHLRGERPRRLQGRRHHADRPQLRPCLPCGVHVAPRPGHRPPEGPLAHLRGRAWLTRERLDARGGRGPAGPRRRPARPRRAAPGHLDAALHAVRALTGGLREALARVLDHADPQLTAALTADRTPRSAGAARCTTDPVDRRVARTPSRRCGPLREQGGGISLEALCRGGVARVRLSTGGGCGSAAARAAQAAVEEAVREAVLASMARNWRTCRPYRTRRRGTRLRPLATLTRRPAPVPQETP